MDRFPRFTALVALPLYILVAYLLSLSGGLNWDEGWYLYASKLVYQGKIPYRDFFFTQPPVFPYLYGIPLKVFGSSVATGRFTSVFFGALSLLVAIYIAKKLGGRACAVVTAGLLICNPFQLYFFSIVKTYALSSFLLLLALYMVTDGRTALRPVATALVVIAVGTRLVLAPAVPVLLYFLVRRGSSRSVRVWTLVAAVLSFALVFLPFWISDREVFSYGLIGYHSERHTDEWSSFLMSKAFLLAELARGYALALALACVALVGRAVTRAGGSDRNPDTRTLAVTFAALFIVQLGAPATYAEYFTNIFPLAAILVGVAAEKCYLGLPSRTWKFGAGAFFAVACVLSMTLTRPGIIPTKEPQLRYLSTVARYVREHSSPEDKIFTMDARIAVEAERELLPGLEMSLFSYFQDWPTERCERYKVINDEIALQYARRREAKIAILSNVSFGLKTPSLLSADREKREEIVRTIEENYTLLEAFPDFLGPNNTLLVFTTE